MPIALLVSLIAVSVILLVVLVACSYVKAAPDEAIRISGVGTPKYLVGRAGFKIPFFQRADRLSLQAIQVDIKTDAPIPTNNFININVDGVATVKVSSDPQYLPIAFETISGMNEQTLYQTIQEGLIGNMREIIGTIKLQELVQSRQEITQKVVENVVPDLQKLGIVVVNFNIQNFSDENGVIENLGVDNVEQIRKSAQIARAEAEKEVAVARAKANLETNEAEVSSKTGILERNNQLSLTESDLKVKADSAKANADAAYEIERQRRQQEINIATVNASIAQREREIDLAEKQVSIAERKLEMEVGKKADIEKYAKEQSANAELFERQKKAEAEKYELERKSEMALIQAEADRKAKEQEAIAARVKAEADAFATVAKAKADAESAVAIANAEKERAMAEAEAIRAKGIAEADGIRAKGIAEAESIERKAEAQKKMGEASVIEMGLKALPEVVHAYSEPLASAYGKIGNITMYGDGNTTKLGSEIVSNGTQILDGLKDATGIDIKTMLAGIAGILGGKMLYGSSQQNTPSESSEN